MTYTSQERARYVLWLSGCGDDYAKFAIKVRREHGQRATVPSRSLVFGWRDKLLETGSLLRKPYVRQMTARTEDNIVRVQRVVRNNPNVSTRSLANQNDISKTTAHRILTEDLNLFPYKAQTAQELLPGDPEKRSQFARRMAAEKLDNPAFARNLVFFDEAHFHLHGVPNRQNFRTWSLVNPNVVVEEPLHSERVTALIGIGYGGIVGPFFFDGNVNGARYLSMLRDHVVPALRHWPNFDQLVLVQDGATPHWTLDVRAFLNEQFPNRWIGRDSPFICWPPRSPDLTPMDYFVWGHLKNRLYKGQFFASIQDLKARVTEEAQLITIGMVLGTMANFWKRLAICEERAGLNVEVTDQ